MRTQTNLRLPAVTLDQIDLICETYGLTKTQVMIMAIDRLAHALNPETGEPDEIDKTKIFRHITAE